MEDPLSSNSFTSQFESPLGGVMATPPSAGNSGRKGSPRGAEMNKLRSELRYKSQEVAELELEVQTLKNLIKAKDDAIETTTARVSELEERALTAEGELGSLRKATGKLEADRKRLQVELDAANREADRLSDAVVNGGNSNGATVEEVVKLHNQLAEARKEIRKVKEDLRGANNVIAAKDKYLDEIADEVESAKMANIRRKDDLNAITDLKRQLKEAQNRLDGSERMGSVSESEILAVRAQLGAARAELEAQRGIMAQMQIDTMNAQDAMGRAERIAAEAKADAEMAITVADKARMAEAARMREGGYISRREHARELENLERSNSAMQDRLKASEEDVRVARVLRERLLKAGDEALEMVLTGEHVAEKYGKAATVVEEMRTQVKDLRKALAAKDAENAALHSLRDIAVARATKEKLDTHQVKSKLAQTMGEYDYTIEFNEPPPGPKEQAEALALAAAAAEAANASSLAGIAAQRDKAFLEASESKAALRQAQAEAQKATDMANQLRAEMEQLSEAKLNAESLSAEGTSSVAEMQATLAANHRAMQDLHDKLEAVKEIEAAQAVELKTTANRMVAAEAEVVKLKAMIEFDKVNKLEDELAAAKKEIQSLENQLDAQLAAHSAATAAAAEDLEDLKEELELKTQEIAAVREQVEAKEEEVAALEEKLEAVQMDEFAAAAPSEVESLKAELATTLIELEAAQDAAQAAAEEIAVLKEDLELGSSAEVEELHAKIEELEAALEGAREHAAALADSAATQQLVHESASNSPDKTLTPRLPPLQLPHSSPHDDLVPELVASKLEVAQLKTKVDELESELSAMSPLRNSPFPPSSIVSPRSQHSRGEEEEDLSEDSADYNREGTAPRFTNRGNAVESAGMTSTALAAVLDRLIEAREAQGGLNAALDDEELYRAATAMLQEELARLGKALAEDTESAARLRSEVGALQTAQLSAEATAELLEQHNALSMRVAALQIALAEKENEYARCEESLLAEISALRAKLKTKRRKGKEALKSVTRAMSSAARGLQKSLDSAVSGVKGGADDRMGPALIEQTPPPVKKGPLASFKRLTSKQT